MGYVESTPKVTLDAFLTQIGRQYLLTEDNPEKYTIFYFGLSDPDTNYDISSTDKIGNVKNILPSGFIPNISGDHDCIKSLTIQKQKYLLTQKQTDINNNFIEFNNI